jgi:Domain of unknown function (DUF4432)
MPTLFGREMTRRELARHVGDQSALFGVELVEHGDGLERSLRVLRFRTGGGLVFESMVDRAMDVGTMELLGVPVGFRSPTLFRAPWLHEGPDAEEGVGWLRSFTGLVNTCGLDHIGGPAEEGAEHYGYPYRKRVRHGLHGRVAYIPARLAGYGARWDGDRCTLWAEGEVRQATMFGEFLVLTRRIEAEVGGTSLTVHDRVENRGFRPTPHAMLYHVNAGFPVVAPGARLAGRVVGTRTYVHDPKATDVGAFEQTAPREGFVEQVYEHEIAAGGDGTAWAALVNPAFRHPAGAEGIALKVAWDARAMPAFYQWQNLQEGNYVVGLEPGTQLARPREEWKKRGELRFLGHGEAAEYRLELTSVIGAGALGLLEG